MIAAFVNNAESWSNVAANAAQAVAIIVGGWWAYTRFIRQREAFPRATLEQVVTHRELDSEHTYLNVALNLHNTGLVLLRPRSVRTDVYQVLPLHPEVRRSLSEGTLVPEGSTYAGWPCVGTHDVPVESKIEPGDRDQFALDFLISTEVKTVYVYSYVGNATAANLGWTLTALYDLDTPSGQQRELGAEQGPSVKKHESARATAKAPPGHPAPPSDPASAAPAASAAAP